jgi:AcrR family transcriptional regulator
MARPKSGDKRTALLNAATTAIAREGLGASTTTIAKLAGIGVGTLFTYFATKEELLNQLFLELKREVYAAIASGFPHQAGAMAQAEHFWNSYLDWGMAHPEKRHATAQLAVSDKISEQIRAQAEEDSAGCYDVLEAHLASGALRDSPPTFVTAIMAALAETTMEFMAKAPEREQIFRRAGFDAFWRATGK